MLHLDRLDVELPSVAVDVEKIWVVSEMGVVAWNEWQPRKRAK